MSSFRPFAGVRASLREKLIGDSSKTSNDSNKQSEEDDQKELEETAKKEKTIVNVLNGTRKKFIERQLCGNIEIDAQFGFSGSGVSLDIEEEDLEELDFTSEEYNNNKNENTDENMETLDGQLSYTEKIAIASVDKLIKSLEDRALSYANASYKDNLEITRSYTIAPPLPILQLSLGISCTSTVPNLLRSRQRRVAENQLLLEMEEMNLQIIEEVQSKGYDKNVILKAIKELGGNNAQTTTKNVIAQINKKK
eukprot:TRINITY_DN106950_c0_g1_i1.p1 TRINITY_DN106950_c0_g1~~TRINITY_DN106950_c0_g1_i1.p1  ORF type:complete len:252 (+),score=15.44 TRINITY_DN106950_c0_g1_i1:16-771(+)